MARRSPKRSEPSRGRSARPEPSSAGNAAGGSSSRTRPAPSGRAPGVASWAGTSAAQGSGFALPRPRQPSRPFPLARQRCACADPAPSCLASDQSDGGMPIHGQNDVIPRPCSPEQICTARLGICNRHLHVRLLDRLRQLNVDVAAWPSALAARGIERTPRSCLSPNHRFRPGHGRTNHQQAEIIEAVEQMETEGLNPGLQ